MKKLTKLAKLTKNRHVVRLPQMGANDEYAVIVEWAKKAGERVEQGNLLCVVETSKAVYDVEADGEGFLIPLADVDEDVEIGAPLAVLSSEPEEVESVRKWLEEEISNEKKKKEGKQEKLFTKKAFILARRLGLDIADVPVKDRKITEADVLEFSRGSMDKEESRSAKAIKESEVEDLVDDIYTENKGEKLLIIGGGYGAVQLLDVINNISGQRAEAILDDDPKTQKKSIMGVPILGNVTLKKGLELYKAGKYDAVVISVSTSIQFRERIFNEWTKENIPFANVIHPTALIGSNVNIGRGNVILAFCHIGACTKIGNNNFLSPYIDIEHHSVLGNHCSFGPGVYGSSSVNIGSRVKFGTGIFIEPFISVGSDSIIASGSVIVNHIPDNVILKTKPNYLIKKRK